MEEKDFTRLVENLKDAIIAQVQEQVYLQTMSKDKEVSGLHRQIRDDIKGLSLDIGNMNTKLTSHDDAIKDFVAILNASKIIKKVIITIVSVLLTLSALVGAVKYLFDVTKHNV